MISTTSPPQVINRARLRNATWVAGAVLSLVAPLFLLTPSTVTAGNQAAGLTPMASFTNDAAAWLAGFNVNARSASLADWDGDGDLDLFFQGASGAQQLLRNNIVGLGTTTFTNVSGMLPAGLGPSWSAAWADYDGDGDVDVFVGQSNIGGSGDVLRNDGGAGFTNASVAVGLNDPGFHQNLAWCDIDGDLDLDLLIGMEGPTEKHEIYLQGPGPFFTPVGAATGFQADVGTKAYGMAVGDTDGDGDVDVYISTCRTGNNIRNNFFENRLADTGTLGFVDIADANGTQFMQNSYGAEFHDFDDDGDLDLFMVGADSQLSKMFRNDGNNQFADIDSITGHPLLSDVGGDLNGGRAIDYDNDGDLDLFFHDHKPLGGANAARKLYRNVGNWQFTDVTVIEGLNATNKGSYDSPWADVDLDGDLDLIATTDGSFSERLFISDASSNGNHWLYLRLRGLPPNTTAIGARLDATLFAGTASERTLRRDGNTNAGTFNQSDTPVHFGLGAATQVDQLRVIWPNGASQELCAITANQYRTLHPSQLGDFNADGLLDSTDLAALVDCFSGPGSPVSPSFPPCAAACRSAFDADGDDDLDLHDFAALQREMGN